MLSNNLLTRPTLEIDTILSEHQLAIDELFSIINAAGILTPANCDLLSSYIISIKDRKPNMAILFEDRLAELANALHTLLYKKILTTANFIEILKQSRPTKVVEAMILVHSAQLLTPENQAIINRVYTPTSVADRNYDFFICGLHTYNNAGILNQDNFVDLSDRNDYGTYARIISILYHAYLLTPENRAIVRKFTELGPLESALIVLVENKLLTQSTLDLVIAHTSPPYAACTIVALNRSGSFTLDVFETVGKLNFDIPNIDANTYRRHDNQVIDPHFEMEYLLGFLFYLMRTAGILTPNNHALIEQHLKGWDKSQVTYNLKAHFISARLNPLINGTQLLRNEGLLNNTTFQDIIKHPTPNDFAQVLCILYRAQLVALKNNGVLSRITTSIYQLFSTLNVVRPYPSPEDPISIRNYAVVQSHSNVPMLHELTSKLRDANLLNQMNFIDVFDHNQPTYFVATLQTLAKAGLSLTDENREIMKRQRNLFELNNIFSLLYEANLLTQVNIDHVFSHVNILLMRREENSTWNRIPSTLLTQERFNEILAICENHLNNIDTGRRRLLLYVNRLMGMSTTTQAFNGQQSTHTASVHQSASESATALHARYGHMITKKQLQEMTAWIKSITIELLHNLPTNAEKLKLEAAQRCLPRLLESERIASFTDPSSTITTYELMALCWMAIHDESTCIGTQLEGKVCLVNALYEIQRDGNISERGIDDGQDDRFICPPGTFNKLIDAFQGYHPDFNIINMTKSSLSAKLPCVVREVVSARLLAYKTTNYDKYLVLCENIKENDAMTLWPEVVKDVEDILFEEFRSLFSQGGKQSLLFKTCIDSGRYTDLSPLSELIAVSTNPCVEPRPNLRP